VLPWSSLKTIISETIDRYTPDHIEKLKNVRILFNLTVRVKLNRMNGYSEYTKELVGEIEKYRKKGIMYKDIADYLRGRGFRSSRGKELSAKLVERMLKKKVQGDKKRRIKHGSIENLQVVELEPNKEDEYRELIDKLFDR
tara:strand:- start:167 stop:589 length:423 start_codon:yes stop_codon:yes gene_type:complete